MKNQIKARKINNTCHKGKPRKMVYRYKRFSEKLVVCNDNLLYDN